jgi:hypothetical protein
MADSAESTLGFCELKSRGRECRDTKESSMEQYDGPLFDCDNAPLDALVATGPGTERVRAVSVAIIRLNEMSSFALR